MNVTITWQTVITVGAVITALALIFKSLRKGMNYAEKPNKNEESIVELRNNIEEQKIKNDILVKGVQALLRSQILHEYNKWNDKKYLPIYARENISNLYETYHNLGGNGAVTDIYNKVMELPTEL